MGIWGLLLELSLKTGLLGSPSAHGRLQFRLTIDIDIDTYIDIQMYIDIYRDI